METNLSLIDTVAKIFACLCIVETVTAIILNTCVLIICLKSKKLRSTSTFKILTVSAFNDMLCCIPWNLEVFTSTMFNYILSYQLIFYCRWISNFLQYTTLHIQSWILLSISVDRLLSMTVKKWTKFYFSGYRPYIFAFFLCLFMAGTNIFEIFTVGYSFNDNETQTEVIMCYVTDPSIGFDWYTFSTKVNCFLLILD